MQKSIVTDAMLLQELAPLLAIPLAAPTATVRDTLPRVSVILTVLKAPWVAAVTSWTYAHQV